MTRPNPDTPLTDLVVRRLRALLRRHDMSAARLSESMGRGRAWLSRKLAGQRPLTLADVDEILWYLGESPAAVLEPVLLQGDAECLVLLQSGTSPDALEQVLADAHESLTRLTDEGLVTMAPDGVICITTRGRQWLRMNRSPDV